MCTHYSSYKETQRLISAFRMRECVYNVKQIFLKLSSHPATFLAEPGAFFFFQGGNETCQSARTGMED